MYESTPGKGGMLPIAGGVAALPNTNGNDVLLVASILTIVIGLAILATSVVRTMVRKAHKA